MSPEAGRCRVEGTISSAGFASGHRFVVGNWAKSPIGPMYDVMWATPDDERILLVGHSDVAEFICRIYRFDDVRVGELSVTGDARFTSVDGLGLSLRLRGGRRWPIPLRRPLWVTRWVERPIARALLGVETFGTSPTGAVEWYQAEGVRWVESGSAQLDEVDLGDVGPVDEPLRVGFSEPPRRPSIVRVGVTIDLPRPTSARPSR